MSNQIVRSYPNLKIDADMVLRGQGADPAVIRQRRPRLVDIAEQVIVEGMRLIEPLVVYLTLPVEKISHERFMLAGNVQLKGALLAEHLAPAQQIALMVCTLGPALESRVTELMHADPAYAFALDGFGSVAAEALGLAICSELEAENQASGLFTSIPVSPGMIGWSVGEGQPQIFSALDAAQIGVSLNESAQMYPHKSVSMMLGISPTPFSAGRTCDFCNMRETCRYQNHEQHFGGQKAPNL
ncbi:MAG: hypothetical protein NTW32_00990 [Chloroflexi bacterium]|nr:hypothetical protein [Chloroflexota bacterium]